MATLLWILLVAAYVASVAGAAWFFSEKVRKKESIWRNQEALEAPDWIICFIPIFNTILTVKLFLASKPKKEGKVVEMRPSLEDEEEDDFYRVRE